MNTQMAQSVIHEYFISWNSFLSSVLSSCASIGIIFGGVIPYVPQYMQIKRTQNADGFSTYVCFTLLIANTLRILFWFGHTFETPLLVQSIVMNLAMLVMMELCVRMKQQNLLVPNRNRHLITKGYYFLPHNYAFPLAVNDDDGSLNHKRFIDFEMSYFWQWTDFVSYIECLATITVFAGIVMYAFIDVPIFVETVGFLAVFTEAMLGAPQLVKNFRNKSTMGMSKKMVFLWTIGDLFKTGYFIFRSAPLQFLVCGVLQVSIDLLILGQVFYYKSPYSKLPKAYDS